MRLHLHLLAVLMLMHTVKLGYQQTIQCPENQILWNGECVLKVIPPSCPPGFNYTNYRCVHQNCSANQIPFNGICYPNYFNLPNYPNYPIYPIYPTAGPTTAFCSHEYTLYNEMCYHHSYVLATACNNCEYFICPPICSIPKPDSTTTTTTTTSTSTTTTTTTITPAPPVCPENSIMMNGECRFIYCIKGIPHQGRCIEPVCTDGLVWSGNSCTEPHTLTTVLEIENRFITKANKTGPVFHAPSITSNVIYHTSTERKPCETTPRPSVRPKGKADKCCVVITPRLCKRRKSNWHCFNRMYNICDSICGNSTKIYLRVPHAIEHSETLVMPPNPPLGECTTQDCSSEHVDCSGCFRNHRATCSPFCYRHSCITDRCRYMDQREYCKTYSLNGGCSSDDGCYDDWCGSYC